MFNIETDIIDYKIIYGFNKKTLSIYTLTTLDTIKHNMIYIDNLGEFTFDKYVIENNIYIYSYYEYYIWGILNESNDIVNINNILYMKSIYHKEIIFYHQYMKKINNIIYFPIQIDNKLLNIPHNVKYNIQYMYYLFNIDQTLMTVENIYKKPILIDIYNQDLLYMYFNILNYNKIIIKLLIDFNIKIGQQCTIDNKKYFIFQLEYYKDYMIIHISNIVNIILQYKNNIHITPNVYSYNKINDNILINIDYVKPGIYYNIEYSFL